jgi:magnesium chelatase family protein
VGETTNASMTPRQMRRYCKLGQAGEALLKQAMTELGLSARAHDRVLRISRTIADLEGEADIQAHHLAEAIAHGESWQKPPGGAYAQQRNSRL